MDEKSILLMSEELRAALGERVSRIETQPAPREEETELGAIRTAGRLLRVSALRGERVRLSVRSDSETFVSRLLSSRGDVWIAVEDGSSEYRVYCRVRSVKVSAGSSQVVTICADRAA